MMSQHQRSKLIPSASVNIAYLLGWNSVFAFQKQRIVKVQKDSIPIYIQHPFTKSLGIVKCINPAMEIYVKLAKALRYTEEVIQLLSEPKYDTMEELLEIKKQNQKTRSMIKIPSPQGAATW